jgi:DNA-binding MarR family transcriptional regulator
VTAPVNRPLSTSVPSPESDGRLYLRDSELDQGAALIRAAARRLSAVSNPAPGSAPIQDGAHDILMEIFDLGPQDVSGLRTRLNIPKQTLARYLNELEARGLIARERDRLDGRRRRIHLTPEGEAMTRRGAETRRATMREVFLLCGPDAVTGARRVLAEIARGTAGRSPMAGPSR